MAEFEADEMKSAGKFTDITKLIKSAFPIAAGFLVNFNASPMVWIK